LALTQSGYREAELLTNRASLLLFGGTDDERRSWAEEAASHFEAEGPLVEVRTGAELLEALRAPRGVVFITDITKVEVTSQRLLVRCLQVQEERPKVVVGVAGSVERARESGILLDDLHYRLVQAQVDLQVAGLRELVAKRKVARKAAAAEKALARKAAVAASKPGTRR